jgi:hypothetical protein
LDFDTALFYSVPGREARRALAGRQPRATAHEAWLHSRP